MRLAFMGTPEFAVPSLAELIASGHEIVAVYSQPPKPRGRGQKLTPSPVQAFAETMGLPVFTPASMKSAEAIETFRSLQVDAACVVAYGQILKAEVLDAPRLGCFNLHGSLLPRWRGAAPIQRAIMAGDRQTGVQIMRMSEGLDEGAILLSESLPIQSDDTAASLSERMSTVGATLWTPLTDISLNNGGTADRFFFQYVQGPDRDLVELNTASHHHFGHIHLFSADPIAAGDWWIKTFGLTGRALTAPVTAQQLASAP